MRRFYNLPSLTALAAFEAAARHRSMTRAAAELNVTVGAVMLTVIWLRCLRGHFTPERHFAFEAVAWYWHFVDVVWLGLFIFVYWL